MQLCFTGAGSPQAARKLTALDEPGNTRLRKSLSSVQTASKIVSVSSNRPAHSNSSSPAAKDPLTDITVAPGKSVNNNNSARIITGLSSTLKQGSHLKDHVVSKANVTSAKLSAEISSLTSSPTLSKGVASSSKFTSIILNFGLGATWSDI